MGNKNIRLRVSGEILDTVAESTLEWFRENVERLTSSTRPPVVYLQLNNPPPGFTVPFLRPLTKLSLEVEEVPEE